MPNLPHTRAARARLPDAERNTPQRFPTLPLGVCFAAWHVSQGREMKGEHKHLEVKWKADALCGKIAEA